MTDKLLQYMRSHAVVVFTRGVNQVLTNDLKARGSVVLSGILEDADYDFIYLSSDGADDFSAGVVKVISRKDIIALVEAEHAAELLALPITETVDPDSKGGGFNGSLQ